MKWFRNLLKGTSLTTALFIFQACYGTGPAYDIEPIAFKVISEEDHSPLGNVNIRRKYSGSDTWLNCGWTDSQGFFQTSKAEGEKTEFVFQDEEGNYAAKDTVITVVNDDVIEIKMKKAE